jgi:hypothetical protein
MRVRTKLAQLITGLAVFATLLAACGPEKDAGVTAPVVEVPAPNALTSIPVSLPPHLDGSGDDLAWQVAPARYLDVTTNGVPPFQMTLKSVYDSENIYILVQYPDLNKDVIRSPWVFNADKKAWERLGDDMGDEDEFGFYWNVNVPNYQAKGCKDLCHDQDPNNKKMYTPAGTWVDIWQVNEVRSAPMGWARDQRLTDNPSASASGGFVEDAGFTTNSGHADNTQTLDGKDVPMYWKPYSGVGGLSVGDAIFLLQSEIDSGYAKKIVKVDANGVLTDEAGQVVPWFARIPGWLLSAPAGPSWNDIKAASQWRNGVWTVELSRKLVTGHADDIQFNVDKDYYFDIYLKTRQAGEVDRQTISVSKFVFKK